MREAADRRNDDMAKRAQLAIAERQALEQSGKPFYKPKVTDKERMIQAKKVQVVTATIVAGAFTVGFMGAKFLFERWQQSK